MIRRPLVWLLGAYLFGLMLAWYTAEIWLLLGLLICSMILIYLMMYRLRNRYITAKDRFLWCLPLLFLLGLFAMKAQMQLPGLAKAFEQEAPCELSGQITMITNQSKGRALYLKNVMVSLSNGETYPCEAVKAYTSDHQSYLIGNHILLQGSIQKFTKASNPGQFDEQMYYRIENIDFKAEADKIVITDSHYSKYHETLNHMKGRLVRVYASILADKEAGALIAMLLGEKYLLDDEIKQLYQVNGISHILAISGLHVSLIGMGIFWLLKKCRLLLPVSTFLTIAIVYSYGVLTNFSVSTNRAVVMMIVMLLASLVGKTYDMLSAMALSAFIILLQNPLQLFSVGFLLSYSAILGIALLYPGLKRLFTRKSKVLDALLVSMSATLATTPIVLVFYYQFPTYGILTNLLILPFITILTLASLIAGLAGLIWLPLGTFLIGGPNYILKLYEGICKVNASFPESLITVGKPGIILVLLSVGFMLTFVLRSMRNPRWYQILYLVVGFLSLFLPHLNQGLEVTMLDVGQGEGIYMENQGTNYLIDGGSADISKVGTYRLFPFLKSQGVSRLDYAIVTHCDKDHINGLTELIEGELITIKRLILPDIKQKEENYLALEELAREKKIGIYYLSEGDSVVNGGMILKGNIISDWEARNNVFNRLIGKETLRIYCLHPTSDTIYSSSNSYSTVLSISFGDLDLLLTGDLDNEGEEQLRKNLEEGYYQKNYQIAPVTDYDVLQVAHHGSKYSTSEEFLQLIRPEFSFISCGRNNWYGHPHPQLLERLEEAKSSIGITNQEGAIMLRTDGGRLYVSKYLLLY